MFSYACRQGTAPPERKETIMLGFFASFFPSDESLVTFAVIGALVTFGTFGTLVVIGMRTVVRSRRVARNAVRTVNATRAVSAFPGL
jgi:hypothetical protein